MDINEFESICGVHINMVIEEIQVIMLDLLIQKHVAIVVVIQVIVVFHHMDVNHVQ